MADEAFKFLTCFLSLGIPREYISDKWEKWALGACKVGVKWALLWSCYGVAMELLWGCYGVTIKLHRRSLPVACQLIAPDYSSGGVIDAFSHVRRGWAAKHG